jgi:hypothetical protein
MVAEGSWSLVGENALSYAEDADMEVRIALAAAGRARQFGGGDHALRKVITWAIVIFVIYYLATDPTGAAHALQSAFNGLRSAGNSMARFVNQL